MENTASNRNTRCKWTFIKFHMKLIKITLRKIFLKTFPRLAASFSNIKFYFFFVIFRMRMQQSSVGNGCKGHCFLWKFLMHVLKSWRVLRELRNWYEVKELLCEYKIVRLRLCSTWKKVCEIKCCKQKNQH